MARLADWLLPCLFPVLVFLHLYISPYTKVEESFNIQAIHDILKYGLPSGDHPSKLRAQYDHFSFPGAVPRSFVGALVVATLSKPLIWLDAQVDRQLIVRGVLGAFNAFALVAYANGVRRAFGRNVLVWYILFQASQFHVIYYASRTLPNMFAFGISTLAFRYLLPEYPEKMRQPQYRRRYRLSLYLLTLAGIIFRSELALLLATTTLYLWSKRLINLRHHIIPAAIVGLYVGLTTTIFTDSLFWQQFPLWPEFSAFKFNVLSGQASAWGTSPWHYYFTNAIPRLLLNPLTYLLAVPLSLSLPATRPAASSLLLPSLTYIALYSIIPHKEWRFILYTIPPLTTSASLGASYLWTHRSKSPLTRLLSALLVLSTLASFALSTLLLLPISATNYPGAHALNALHTLAHNSQQSITVHMDNLACQTGVTRFLEFPEPGAPLVRLPGSPDGRYPVIQTGATRWVYDKTEMGELERMEREGKGKGGLEGFWEGIDYALVEVVGDDGAGAGADPKVAGNAGGGQWEVVGEVSGFGGVRVLRAGEGEGKVEEGILRQLLGERAVEGWRVVRGLVRRYVTRGWWVEVKMVPRVRILRHFRR
ncbi:dolichyl-P-Man:Man(7)GlcNAc(2)-PP-dolichol alpha-1,6-mannosyltransferase [Onygenales sp. PD_12]|nr:dolichyl-P-Man:Man(7)GlcNAc(2)-PP-dolichol alpha-1,6-mannosyltransferase [Onygenales sp. PD_12]